MENSNAANAKIKKLIDIKVKSSIITPANKV